MFCRSGLEPDDAWGANAELRTDARQLLGSRFSAPLSVSGSVMGHRAERMAAVSAAMQVGVAHVLFLWRGCVDVCIWLCVWCLSSHDVWRKVQPLLPGGKRVWGGGHNAAEWHILRTAALQVHGAIAAVACFESKNNDCMLETSAPAPSAVPQLSREC